MTNSTAANTLSLLRAARGLVAKGWTQGAYGRTDAGLTCMGESAVCFCAAGALLWPDGLERKTAFSLLAKELPTEFLMIDTPVLALVAFNDSPGRTQAEILALYDRAIAKLEAAP